MPPLPKPYSVVPIRECGEAMIAIPHGEFAFFDPHPYVAAGAPYGVASPWMLRRTILESLRLAQRDLQRHKPGWRVMLFDAYRPHAVQAFMVAREVAVLAQAAGLDANALTGVQHDALMEKVLRVWSIPSDDPATPPPHSTGAVFDCTLADAAGREVDMGSPIDENSDRSLPDYFAAATDEAGQRAHAHRLLLRDIMRGQGFCRHPTEWWHFSRGDQLAVWAEHGVSSGVFAVYGRVDV